MAASFRWVRPEIYPLLVPIAGVVGLCSMQLVRNVTTNPEVRVTKQNRAAGVLDNFAEGERYKEHVVRRFLRNKSTEIMPSLNQFFAGPRPKDA